ncbi:hypothetical protein HanPI659440_Chr06g0251731 [Helianthus annuus]|nr:hypothetical protein HanPI659440_Chr06g0251731 [Helianthus annuus]
MDLDIVGLICKHLLAHIYIYLYLYYIIKENRWGNHWGHVYLLEPSTFGFPASLSYLIMDTYFFN